MVRSCVLFAKGCLVGLHRDRMCLFDGPASRTIRDIHASKFERPPTVVAAAGIELRGMVRERKRVSAKKCFEAKLCGVELCLRLVEPFLRDQYVSETPLDLWIAARKGWHE